MQAWYVGRMVGMIPELVMATEDAATQTRIVLVIIVSVAADKSRRCGTEEPHDGRPVKCRCGKNGTPFSATTRPMYTKSCSYG